MRVDAFSDKKVQEPLKKFKTRLAECTDKISSRNKERVDRWSGVLTEDIAKGWEYKYLIPENIPQSINI